MDFPVPASEDALAGARDSLIHDYLDLFSLTMLYYDQLLTLPAEIAYIWTRPRSTSSIMFLLNRWLGFAGNLVVATLSLIPFPQEVCSRFNYFRQIMLVINEAVVCVILALRVYALYERTRRVLALFSAVSLLMLGLTGWSLSGQKSTVTQYARTGCHMELTTASGHYLAIPWEMLFVFDCTIFALTVRATYNAHRQAQGQMLADARLPLVTVILRDGAIYFGGMALANLSNILTFHFSPALLKGCLTTLASNLSMLLTSRLMLNMHKHAFLGIMTTTFRSGDTRRTSLRFREGTIRTASDEQPAHVGDVSDNLASGSSV
ncbi:hypothetical protein PLICRDRAFT_450349 [Plicaturopsis crispa FD-325 SS-3]|uniref:Unplaced genomic scaffold PLICRscaffold_25, whole genome shotgun sequence n=1 Tax=Plicaturopsis crispa FD-325 SS-3 TaxID=944288 RepID=A0A0C9SK93_PLICR|nr:hypothetical protein PLICRDRAFT_450349 [Plicaturopsis crispa FD-325 SS-3]